VNETARKTMQETSGVFRVYWAGEHPKPKRMFFKGDFDKRRKAVHWCRNHQWEYRGLTIVHPDGQEEPYQNGTMD
jgi:hypothetical protein